MEMSSGVFPGAVRSDGLGVKSVDLEATPYLPCRGVGLPGPVTNVSLVRRLTIDTHLGPAVTLILVTVRRHSTMERRGFPGVR